MPRSGVSDVRAACTRSRLCCGSQPTDQLDGPPDNPHRVAPERTMHDGGADRGTSRSNGRSPQFMLDIDHLPVLARGCAVMGSGGGGDPLIGVLMAREAM